LPSPSGIPPGIVVNRYKGARGQPMAEGATSIEIRDR
jgi:hypothetical protein